MRVARGCVAVSAALLLSCCGNAPEDAASSAATEAISPVASPPLTATPVGRIQPTDSIAYLAAVPDSPTVAAVTGADRRTLTLLPVAAPARDIDLGATAAGLAAGHSGEILVPAASKVLRIVVATGTVSAVPVDGNATAAIPALDGGLLVGTADGRVLDFGPDGHSRHSVSGLRSVDGLAATEAGVFALDRARHAVSLIDVDAERVGESLGAGAGAMVADHFGRILVTDPQTELLTVLTGEPLLIRQRFPVRFSPYAVAYDRHTETVWVCSSGSNTVIGFDLATGIPKEVGRYPTVRQPNSLAIDDRTGELVIGSAASGGLQRIERQ